MESLGTGGCTGDVLGNFPFEKSMGNLGLLLLLFCLVWKEKRGSYAGPFAGKKDIYGYFSNPADCSLERRSGDLYHMSSNTGYFYSHTTIH